MSPKPEVGELLYPLNVLITIWIGVTVLQRNGPHSALAILPKWESGRWMVHPLLRNCVYEAANVDAPSSDRSRRVGGNAVGDGARSGASAGSWRGDGNPSGGT